MRQRDHQQSVHSPSSTSTARPPSTARESLPRAKRAGKQNGKGPTPVLLRDKHIHTDEPRTPPVSSSERAKTIGGHKEEGELELDLESLGLEDREIAPDKLTKMEKIGSGGFKEYASSFSLDVAAQRLTLWRSVFVGKMRNRKVAIAEFRGQLSASTSKQHLCRIRVLIQLSGHQGAQIAQRLRPSQRCSLCACAYSHCFRLLMPA